MKIAITGANSYLGQYISKFLLENSNFELILIHSHNANESSFIESDRVLNFKVDLTSEFSVELKEILKQTDKLFHFAWIRGKNTNEIIELNKKMIKYLISAIEIPEKLFFISSVSGTPNSKSDYGKTKYHLLKFVEQEKANSIILGLVIESNPQKGPYKMLLKVAKTLPISFRFSKNEPFVFPIHIEIFSNNMLKIINENNDKQFYTIFENPVKFNNFMEKIETHFPKRRLKFKMNANLLLKIAFFGKKVKIMPRKISDQILTFFYKDEDFLLSKFFFNFNIK